MFTGPIIWRSIIYSVLMILGKLACGLWVLRPASTSHELPSTTEGLTATAQPGPEESEPKSAQSPIRTRKTIDLYPASILGFAMVARGEIGFLIAAIAEARGIFRDDDTGPENASDLYLIVCWAVLICTIVGPISVGIAVKRWSRSKGSRGGRWLEAET